jgi:ubiquinone/menaquinone biosynthesis C-methylase UbiE
VLPPDSERRLTGTGAPTGHSHRRCRRSTRPPHALLGNLPEQAGGTIRDLACGTGSPTFEAARRNPGARVLGVDRAAKLIGAAQALAAAHAIGNVDFEVMSLDALTLPDKSVDAAISRFGFLQEGDVTASAKQPSRVLKDGAPFSVAAFDAMEFNTLFSRAARVLQRHVPTELLPDFDYLTELATPGLRERLLREAGISTLHPRCSRGSCQYPRRALSGR